MSAGDRREMVIVSAVRTPLGTHGGALREVTAQELARGVMVAALQRARLEAANIDEVVFGCAGQMSDAPNLARVAGLMAGIPVEIPGYTVQRNCASGLEAITSACRAIRAGDGDVYLVGGSESMSSYPYAVRGARWGLKLRHTTFIDTLWEGLTDPICGQLMGRTAENLVEHYEITREEQDEYAVGSHKRAFVATRTGRFVEEIVPVEVKSSHGPAETVSQDEGINPGLTIQKLAMYPAVFKEGGTVTPGNSSSLNDGAAALVVVSADKARELGLQPLASIRSYAYAGVAPEVMGLGPVHSIPKALKKAGLELKDIDLIELNEAFAAQVLAVGRELEGDGWEWEKVNVNGGAIALGHPVGCSGARITVTLLHEMIKRDVNLGMATLCVGGGQGGTLIIERN
ncbi:MAG: thiolase family protein [Chloroflexi bacterium]|nr:thiolase family protein [Chloroflexota bacterium]